MEQWASISANNRYLRPMLLTAEQDPMGQAMLDYQAYADPKAVITVRCDVAEDDVIPVPWLFRSWKLMPAIERAAIKSCYGRVLDLGAGAGSHALELQKRGLEVVAADVSPGAVEVMTARGVLDARHADIDRLGEERFDTVLLMMNGIGITGTIEGLKKWLEELKPMLNPGGQIVFDTSDIEYLYIDEFGDSHLPDDRPYYGEVHYQMEYAGIKGPDFPWLYLDSITLTDVAYDCGFDVELLDTGKNFTYLVRLTRL